MTFYQGLICIHVCRSECAGAVLVTEKKEYRILLRRTVSIEQGTAEFRVGAGFIPARSTIRSGVENEYEPEKELHRLDSTRRKH